MWLRVCIEYVCLHPFCRAESRVEVKRTWDSFRSAEGQEWEAVRCEEVTAPKLLEVRD